MEFNNISIDIIGNRRYNMNKCNNNIGNDSNKVE